MIFRDRIAARLRRRPRPTGELGRLLDAYPGPGASLAFSVDGNTCAWLEGSCCTPTMSRDRPTFDAAALLADAEAAGLHRDQLVDSLARIDDPAHRAALERAAGRPARDPSPAERRRIAARQLWPTLDVRRVRDDDGELLPGWSWTVTSPLGEELAPGVDDLVALPSRAAAFEVGLAHLAVVSATWALDEGGATLPAGWERLPAGA